jgi:hypothetical protein
MNAHCCENLKSFCKREIYRFRYAMSGYHSDGISSINMLHERTLCSRSRTREQYFYSVYRVYSAILTIF